MAKQVNPDFRAIFEGSPAAYMILSLDLRIEAVSDAYLRATMTERDKIVGRGLFEVFPDNPDDPQADGVRKLTQSLTQVLETKHPHVMGIQKYDIPNQSGGFEVRYWRPTNSPVLDSKNNILYITHHVEDVTQMLDVLDDAMDLQKSMVQDTPPQ